ncbi:MAG: Fe-S protein assembly chaperone HscA [Gammaproteobacteria bacterium]|nr:Fe-S protein assembly chaperone HscA [Gammaproteobacteria bacterium]NNL06862.1 Fe-S protein assembly chaperone HscA [Gammaproteobacteria bacterium]
MALLQIAEPGQSSAPHRHKLAVGIDLGTTNSLVATVRSGEVQTLPDEQGEHLLPSVVRYLEDGVEVGFAAEQQAISDPMNTIVSVKRFMGRAISDLHLLGNRLPYHFVDRNQAVPRIHTRGGDVSATEVSAEILKSLKQRAEKTLGGELQGAVITVPAYFDEAQRQATKDAASLSGLNVLRLLNEPTAAAVAYGLDSGREGIIAVYDLGGGTFDISILRLNHGIFEVLATGGDSALGGDDFDHAIAEWILQQADYETDPEPSLVRQLMRAARIAKEALTEQDDTSITIEADGFQWQGQLSRDQLDRLIEPLIRKTLMSCRRALRDANIDNHDIIEVVMVGGSTRVPHVRHKVGEFFECEPLVTIDPDRVVAIGAALQADVLVGNKSDEDMLLLDIIPLSLGIETMGGLSEKIIHRNTPIPVSRAQEFTTYKDGQTALALHVLQGERELVSDCRSLAHFELRGIPPQVAGAPRIRVTFQVDADGLLSVHAREENSGIEASVDVKPSYGLTDAEIESMLRASMEHAEEDMQARMLREEQVEAERVIEALDSAIEADGHLLGDDERNAIMAAREQLLSARAGDDPDSIKRAVKGLEAACEQFVARRMNTSIRKAMQGHSIDEYETEDD